MVELRVFISFDFDNDEAKINYLWVNINFKDSVFYSRLVKKSFDAPDLDGNYWL